ncbi:radical SAM protein [Clostridium sp. Marseille-Q2269]|uniref:PapB family radical SAM/SPASM ranthipeptide maturase n=1 Tax=Clostridium sp. Marseille-Q2269 TaxID=2942205 RepID=UPI0020731930|nr:radical SAM protein [Clostridium sp. Marseille-Q2269]
MNEILEKSKFYSYDIIYENEKKYLYNIITSGIFTLDNTACNILENNVDEKINNEEYKETLKFMKENFIIQTDENDVKLKELYDKIASNKKEMNASSLVLMVTQDCNLRCTYCYGVNGVYNHKGVMDENTAKKAIDYFIKYSSDEKLNICFFGGEPLLNFKLIKKLVEYAKVLEKKNNKKIGFSMTTNGTLINKEIEEFIIQNRIYTTISIDGDKEIQNSNRFYDNKKGCYDQVIKNTEQLRKTNLLTARATISPKNSDILHNVDHLIDIGFKKVAWAPALNLLNDEDMENIVQGQKEVILKVEKCIKKGDFDRAKKYLTVIDMLNKVKSDGLRTKGCGSGTNIMAVNIEGNIYPCHRFVGNEFMRLGNIRNDIPCENDSFYSNVGLKEFEKCATCLSRNICAGGCINENFEMNQDIRIPPEKLCKSNKQIAREIIKLYIRLDNEQKEKLFGKKNF